MTAWNLGGAQDGFACRAPGVMKAPGPEPCSTCNCDAACAYRFLLPTPAGGTVDSRACFVGYSSGGACVKLRLLVCSVWAT